MKKYILILLLVIGSFKVLSQVPNSPILVLPPEEASVVSLTPTLEWQAVSGADCYFIFITTDTNNLPTLEVCMTSTNSYVVPASTLAEDGLYYWRVQAHNSFGWSIPSQYFSFKTVSTTAEGCINNIIGQVNNIVLESSLSANQGTILNNILQQANYQLSLSHEFYATLYLYYFKLRVFILDASNMLPESDAASLQYSADGVIDLIQTLNKPEIVNIEPPKEFKLQQNYPNPFNPVTTIEYTIPANSNVTLKIYDILGKEITTIVDKYQTQGSYIVNWNASNYSSGIYVYKLTAGSFIESKKMILSK